MESKQVKYLPISFKLFSFLVIGKKLIDLIDASDTVASKENCNFYIYIYLLSEINKTITTTKSNF